MHKLVQINISVNFGSTGKIAEQIGGIAQHYGWESYIAYGRTAGNSTSHLIQIGNMWDERWHGVMTRLFDRHGLASKNATRRLVKKIDKIHPDIIQLHNIHGYYLNYPILFEYLAKSKIPIVWTLHDCWTMTGHCSNFDSIGCMKWKTGCYDCQLKKSYPASFGDRSSKNYLAKKHYFNLPENMTIVTVSNWLRDVVSKSILSNYPIRVITNGINLNSFKRSKHYSMVSKLPVVLGVASVWTNLKGLSDLIKLSEHKNIQIVLVGLTSVQINKLPNNIIGVNRTSNQEELVDYYSMADVFVNPTYEDTFGLVNVEAQACGTPVVSYRTGGCPETISSDTGVLVEKGDVEGLYEAIMSILNKSPEDREAQRRACVARAKEFDAQKKFKEYIDLYEQILSDK